MLLPHERIAEFGSVGALLSDLSYLNFLVGSIEVWGVKSMISGEFDDDKYESCVNITNKLLSFLLANETAEDTTTLGGASDGNGKGETKDADPTCPTNASNSTATANHKHQKVLVG